MVRTFPAPVLNSLAGCTNIAGGGAGEQAATMINAATAQLALHDMPANAMS
jgi:hypothetical protein